MNIKKYNIIGAIFTIIFGTILHFTYELSNENMIVGFFSPINESVWEHLKMLITPMLAFSIFEYMTYAKDIENFLSIRAISIFIGMFLIISLFYTYSGILGKNFFVFDILIFFVSIILSYYFSYKFLGKDILISNNINFIALIFLLILIFTMIYFTKSPLNLPLFESII